MTSTTMPPEVGNGPREFYRTSHAKS
jgi:hypothetical protein